ncbi:hypothetical protein PCL_03261 [Purpureocillium lilacinum]|uniref:Uncharacterized protein n=1 Tax=Purpureocillium lilacinum TaxID=33203 RepID=A0A2U3ENI3_PURLI|nr:hypothetical protein PCL_03261 [Purpureocillium lilacinum]
MRRPAVTGTGSGPDREGDDDAAVDATSRPPRRQRQLDPGSMGLGRQDGEIEPAKLYSANASPRLGRAGQSVCLALGGSPGGKHAALETPARPAAAMAMENPLSSGPGPPSPWRWGMPDCHSVACALSHSCSPTAAATVSWLALETYHSLMVRYSSAWTNESSTSTKATVRHCRSIRPPCCFTCRRRVSSSPTPTPAPTRRRASAFACQLLRVDYAAFRMSRFRRVPARSHRGQRNKPVSVTHTSVSFSPLEQGQHNNYAQALGHYTDVGAYSWVRVIGIYPLAWLQPAVSSQFLTSQGLPVETVMPEDLARPGWDLQADATNVMGSRCQDFPRPSFQRMFTTATAQLSRNTCLNIISPGLAHHCARGPVCNFEPMHVVNPARVTAP